MTIAVTHSTAADSSFSATGVAAWEANHVLVGVGTMAEQNANNVNITGGSISGVTGLVSSVGATAPLASSGGTTPTLSISQANSTTNGYLSSTDWNTFNNKQPAGSYLTAVTASSPLSGSGTVGSPLVIAQATTSTSGYLSSTDWNTFNSKAASGANSDITSLSGITGAISTPNYILFNTSYATALTAGQLGWDGNNTLGLGMVGGNVTQHIGEDQFFYCKASSAITKGQVVMFTGAVGASGIPTGAPATGITDGTYIMGIAAESIALNGFGLIQTFGTLRNVNTSGYADGDILWYNPSVTGGLTKTKPSAPNVKAQMAAVINGGSSGGGTILIRINPGSTLGGTDSNAQINGGSNGDLITYNGAGGYYSNTALGAGTGISVGISSTGVLTITNTSPSSGGTVTSVGGTGSVSGITLSGTVTSSGNLTLGGSLDLSSPPVIGGTAPNLITGTTITATKFAGVGGGVF